jgi:drug/metabolite transporter (DMT)-like permease
LTIEALPFVALLGFFFGSTLIASRFAVGQYNPITYIGLRMVIAALACVVVYLVASRRYTWPRDPKLWKHAALLGVFGTAIPMTSIVTSLVYQSSGVTSVLLTAGPAITVVMAHFALADETLNWHKSMGVILALSGALLLTLRGESGLPGVQQASLAGYGLVFLAMFCGSAMTIYARKFMRGFDSFQVTSVRLLTAALVIMPLSIIFAGINLHEVNTQGYFALGYAALVGTFSGFFLAFYNIKRFGATTAAMVLYIVPIVASIGGILILNETITLGIIMGTVLIVAGIALINSGSKALLDTRRKTV